MTQLEKLAKAMADWQADHSQDIQDGCGCHCTCGDAKCKECLH